jgi:cyclase
MVEYGAGEILLTSMDRDGTRDASTSRSQRAISETASVPVIASGGVGNLQHLVDGSWKDMRMRARREHLHFGEYTIGEAKAFNGLPRGGGPELKRLAR